MNSCNNAAMNLGFGFLKKILSTAVVIMFLFEVILVGGLHKPQNCTRFINICFGLKLLKLQHLFHHVKKKGGPMVQCDVKPEKNLCVSHQNEVFGGKQQSSDWDFLCSPRHFLKKICMYII